MTDIQFDEQEYTTRPAFIEKRSFMANLVIRLGLAKDNSGAQKVLLIVFGIIVALIIGINWPHNLSGTELPAEEFPGAGTPGI